MTQVKTVKQNHTTQLQAVLVMVPFDGSINSTLDIKVPYRPIMEVLIEHSSEPTSEVTDKAIAQRVVEFIRETTDKFNETLSIHRPLEIGDILGFAKVTWDDQGEDQPSVIIYRVSEINAETKEYEFTVINEDDVNNTIEQETEHIDVFCPLLDRYVKIEFQVIAGYHMGKTADRKVGVYIDNTYTKMSISELDIMQRVIVQMD